MGDQMSDTITVVVPARFWEDHMERDCRAAVEEKAVGKKYRLTLDRDGWDDLLSDCWFHLDFLREEHAYLRAIAVSAAYTLAVLAKTDIPWPAGPNNADFTREIPRWAAPTEWAAWTGVGQ